MLRLNGCFLGYCGFREGDWERKIGRYIKCRWIERHSRTHRLALCFLSIPPCHHSGNGWEYLPIKDLVYLTRTAGWLQSLGVDGVLHLEPRPIRALEIESNTKGNIWSMEHGSKKERKRQKLRDIFIPCVVLLSHKYCYRKLTPGIRNPSSTHANTATNTCLLQSAFTLQFFDKPQQASAFLHSQKTHRHINGCSVVGFFCKILQLLMQKRDMLMCCIAMVD